MRVVAYDFGSWATCPAGMAVTQYCGSGENKDCSGYVGYLWCGQPFAADNRYGPMNVYRTDPHQTKACPDGYVITAVCFSGKNSDCAGYRSIITCTR